MKTGAVILAGGKSRRMGGKSKANMTVNNLTVIERLVNELSFFDELLISAEKGIGYEKYCRVVPDKCKDCGPFGGIYSALTECESEKLFVLACDMPLVKGSTVKKLCEYDIQSYDIMTASREGRVEPLFGIYKKQIAIHIKKCLENKMFSFRDISEGLNIKLIDINELTDNSDELFNMNTPKDYFDITGINI